MVTDFADELSLLPYKLPNRPYEGANDRDVGADGADKGVRGRDLEEILGAKGALADEKEGNRPDEGTICAEVVAHFL